MFEFLKESNVPDVYKKITGDKCKFCLSDLIVNENRTVVKCPNHKCPKKIASCINKITTEMGIKGIGKEKSMEYVKAYGYKRVTDFLMTPPIGMELEMEKYIKNSKNITQAVQRLYIPKMGERVSKLFDGYTKMDDFLSSIDMHKDYIWGVVSDAYGYGGLYEEVLEAVYNNIDELYNIDCIFTHISERNYSVRTMNICITEKINSRILEKVKGYASPSKEEFINILNSLFNELGIAFNLKKSVTNEVSAVLHDGSGETIKTREGARRGILMTSDELLGKLLDRIGEENNKND